MKKTLLIACSMFFGLAYSQEFCGFTKIQEQNDLKYPEAKLARKKIEADIRKNGASSYLRSMGINSRTQTIYEVPVVVHIIESSDASNASYSLTDAEIQAWIDNCNKIYATTAGGDFFAQGTDASTGGTVIPFKLVLAKRDPNCQATTGIKRYSGSSLAGYDAYGVKADANKQGVTIEQVRAIAPHWAENAYYNMYIVVGLNENKTGGGLMGWAGMPTNSDATFETVMKVSVVKNATDTTLAHEFAHSLGLEHTFGSANSNGGECPATTGDCTKDDDKVCDTERGQSLLQTNPVPTANDVNTCTNAKYNGVQFNIMNYTAAPRKFTPGQRDRGIAMFMASRSALTKSLGGTAPSGSATTLGAACTPANTTNIADYNAGPTSVKLGTIDVPSSGLMTGGASYVDYTAQSCISSVVQTQLLSTASSEVRVGVKTNDQFIKVWIDFNNNNTFEASELVAESGTSATTKDTELVKSFTPPTSVVLDKPLRMRVRADFNDIADACGALNSGQTEDYMVTFKSSLATSEAKANSTAAIYPNPVSNEFNIDLGSAQKVSIYTVTGQLVKSVDGTKGKNTIQASNLKSGVYMVKVGDKTYKMIKN